MTKFLYIIILLAITLPVLHGQANERSNRYVQVSGIITDETDRLVSGVSVISIKMRHATISEPSGIYSITSEPGDTIFFRALGYKRYHTIIPRNYTGRFASVDIKLEFDTVQIEGVNIMPWSTYSEFIKDITQNRPVDPIIENMNDNLASIYVAIQNDFGVKINPEAGFRYLMEQNAYALYTKNQYPVNNLLNPFAWASLAKGVKNGLLRNQNFQPPKEAKVRKKIKNAEKK